MPTVFLKQQNGAESSLRVAHTAGDGALQLQLGEGTLFGLEYPARVSAVHATSGVHVIYRISARTDDILTVDAAIEGTTDIDLPADSVVGMRPTAGAISDVEAVVNTLETATAALQADVATIHQSGLSEQQFLAVGASCTVDEEGIETGCIAAGVGSEVVDGTGEGGADWAFAMGAYDRSQSCASFVIGSNGLGYSRDQLVVGGGTFGAEATVGAGDAQTVIQPLIGASTNAAAVTLAAGGPGGPGNTVSYPLVRSGRTVGCTVSIVGRKTDGTKHAMFVRRALLHNEGGTLSLEGSVQTIGTDINAPGWSVSVGTGVDDGSPPAPALIVQCTGEAIVHWKATVIWDEVG